MHAEFLKEFHYDRRPKEGVAFVVQPGARNVPRDVAEAAIKAGAAIATDPPPKRKTTNKRTTTTAA